LEREKKVSGKIPLEGYRKRHNILSSPSL